MKVLIIRFSSIGDIVLTTPVIRCVKKQVPGVEVHVLTKNNFASIFKHNPYLDKLHLLNDSLSETIQMLKLEKFDYVIDLHHNLRSLKVKRALGAQNFAFNKLNIEKFILTNFKINRLPKIHIVDRLLATAQQLNVINDGDGLDYFVSKEDENAILNLPESHQKTYVGLVIGAARATKQLPIEKLKELCTLINYPIVLMGGPEDKSAGDIIANVNTAKIYNSCGLFNLNQSAALVKHATIVVAHDTGLMHIAAAFKKPIISIWGNTVPEFGMTPYYGNHTVPHHIFEVPNPAFQSLDLFPIQTQTLSCRPCSKIGYKQCPKKHFKCMNLQSMSAISEVIHNLMTKL